MNSHKHNQHGLITMEVMILLVIAVVVYFVYRQVLKAQG